MAGTMVVIELEAKRKLLHAIRALHWHHSICGVLPKQRSATTLCARSRAPATPTLTCATSCGVVQLVQHCKILLLLSTSKQAVVDSAHVLVMRYAAESRLMYRDPTCIFEIVRMALDGPCPHVEVARQESYPQPYSKLDFTKIHYSPKLLPPL